MSKTFRGYNMTQSDVTITQVRYDELREAERYAVETARENYNAERLVELERMYRELKDALVPDQFVQDKEHSEVVAMARMMRERVNEAFE